METVLAILLAGGAGERLSPLTRDTAKPAVCFGGVYRIIDFTLSNCINSDLRRIFILTQYKSLDLIRHIRDGWNILSPELGEFIETIPPMKRLGDDWYLGTADAVFQNSQSIAVGTARADPDPLRRPHLQDELSRDGRLAPPAPRRYHHRHHPGDAPGSRTASVSPKSIADYRVVGFEEKPQHGDPARSVFNPEMVSASMGIYVFNTDGPVAPVAGRRRGIRTPRTISARTSFRPRWRTARVIAYDFRDINDKQARYWRDVGTIDAFYEANMDLVAVTPGVQSLRP